jgi:hypothetical protein
MLRFRRYNVLLLVLSLWGCSDRHDSDRKLSPLIHTQNVIVLTVSETKFQVPDLKSRYQVVTFTTRFNEWSLLNLAWEESQANFPEVEYVFYYSGNDTVGLKNWMVQQSFAYPILYDYKGEFRRENIKGGLTNISFVVKDGKIVDLSNAGRPDFEEILNGMISD